MQKITPVKLDFEHSSCLAGSGSIYIPDPAFYIIASAALQSSTAEAFFKLFYGYLCLP
jgi:hypothetical protein